MAISRRVIVTGDDSALRRLSEVLSGPERLVEDRDGWAITAPEIDRAPSAEEARLAAKSIAAQLSGLARVEYGARGPLTIAHVVEEDTDTGRRHVFVFAEAALVMGAALAATTISGGAPAPRVVTNIERGMALRHERRVALVLELLAEPPSWPTLYKILDAVEEDVGGERALERLKWVPRAELKRFTQSANAIETARSGGRHAKTKYTLGPSAAMTLPEAEELIATLVRSWLRYRAGE